MRMRFAWSDPAVLRSVVCLVMVLIVALVPVGCGSDGDDDVAVASDLIDQWVAGWNDNDADAIAAVFTEDGTFINEGDLQNRWTGREEIRREAAALVSTVWDMESAGPVTMADDGTFRAPLEFRRRTNDFVAENEFEVEDGLISRMVGQVELVESAN